MRNVPWWVWVSATPMGLGAWAPIAPGVRQGKRNWVLLGVLWSVVALVGWVAAVISDGGAGAGLLILAGWFGAIATALAIRPAYARDAASSSSFASDRAAAERRLQERREAQRLAAENPALAVELGIGRPDVPGARHAGLVDVNNAAASALATLPGIDDALAARIVELRAEVNGCSSVNELGELLDLDGNAVERLKDRAVFLPR